MGSQADIIPVSYSTELEPPDGVEAKWRELNEDEQEEPLDESSESEEDFEQSEHMFNIALAQYDALLRKDPENASLQAKREILIRQRAEELGASMQTDLEGANK